MESEGVLGFRVSLRNGAYFPALFLASWVAMEQASAFRRRPTQILRSRQLYLFASCMACKLRKKGKAKSLSKPLNTYGSSPVTVGEVRVAMMNAWPSGSEENSQAAYPWTGMNSAANAVRKSADAVAGKIWKTLQTESGAFLGLSSLGPVLYLFRTISSGFILSGLHHFSALCDRCGPCFWVPGCAPSAAARQSINRK